MADRVTLTVFVVLAVCIGFTSPSAAHPSKSPETKSIISQGYDETDIANRKGDHNDCGLGGATIRYPDSRTRPGNQSITYSLAPNKYQVNVTVEYGLPRNADLVLVPNLGLPGDEFQVLLPRYRDFELQDAEGFDRKSDRILDWDEETLTPSLTYSLNTTRGENGEWAYFSTTQNVIAPSDNLLPGRQTHHINGSGITSSGASPNVYLGEYKTYSIYNSSQTKIIVIPEHSQEPLFGINHTKRWLKLTSDRLHIGGRDPRIIGFVFADTSLRARGSATSFYMPYDDGETVLLEEYIHTRQSNSVSIGETGMNWFIEGFAQHFKHLIEWRNGLIEYDHYLETRLEPGAEYAGVVLTDQSTYPDNNVRYYKGALVTAALDKRIRNVTNGRQTIHDVTRRVNHRSIVNYQDFKEIVANTTGVRFDQFLETYVNSSGTPEIPRDPEPYRTRDVKEFNSTQLKIDSPSSIGKGQTVTITVTSVNQEQKAPAHSMIRIDDQMTELPDDVEFLCMSSDQRSITLRPDEWYPKAVTDLSETSSTTISYQFFIGENTSTNNLSFNVTGKVGDDYTTKNLTIDINETDRDLNGNGHQATDPDGDGFYEDIDGDGTFSILDVQTFFVDRNSDAIQNNIAAFDFSGDGKVGIVDIQKLFIELTG